MSIEQRLTAAHKQQDVYLGAETERAKIADITFVAFIGGVATGKNFFMHESGFYIVGTETSRGTRIGDDAEKYTYKSNEEMLSAIEHREYIQYGINVPTRSIYATRGAHYQPGTINTKDIWFDAVGQLENKGFESVKTVSVLTPAVQWRDQLDDRFYGYDEGYVNDRLKEARESVRWSYAQHLARSANHLLIINDDTQTAGNLDRIRKFAHGKPIELLNDDLVSEVANQMFATIKNYRDNKHSQVA